MRTRTLAWVGAALLLMPGTSHARKIGYMPTSEQLNAQATVVCNGEVISTALTGPNLVSVYAGGGSGGYAETWMTARVKVLHVFKGSAPAEIVFKYRVPQPNVLLFNSPIHMHLAAGERYRFFLKPGQAKGEFVSVLDGRIDDGYGFQTLCPTEANDSPFLGTNEAVRIALDYLHRKKPGAHYDPALTHVRSDPGGIVDEVTFAASHNLGAEEATVAVFLDRTVDEKGSRLNDHL
jgi:hypothetical protein